MIIDLPRFLIEERKYWTELERTLDRVESEPIVRLGIDEVRRFYYLYQRACADLVKIQTSAHDRALSEYLESLVARAYSEIYAMRRARQRFSVLRWVRESFPQAFRRRRQAFALAVALTLFGALFGGVAIRLDPDAKPILMPFPHLAMDPKERVKMEEEQKERPGENLKATFSAFLMTHNIKVAIFTLSLGATWGIGTAFVLFQNGVMLGAVVADYVGAGETPFLVGWLLPHGIVEIPAVLIAAQAGFVLAGALLGRRQARPLVDRLRAVSRDLVTLIAGATLLLVWAGIIEAFFSQYHEPALPYSLKIGFGVVEGIILAVYLMAAGRQSKESAKWGKAKLGTDNLFPLSK